MSNYINMIVFHMIGVSRGKNDKCKKSVPNPLLYRQIRIDNIWKSPFTAFEAWRPTSMTFPSITYVHCQHTKGRSGTWPTHCFFFIPETFVKVFHFHHAGYHYAKAHNVELILHIWNFVYWDTILCKNIYVFTKFQL